MAPDWSMLEIDIGGADVNRLLADWRWLVTSEYSPFSMTVFGDWFLEGPGKAVFMLDLAGGELKRIADSKVQFCELRNEQANLDEWYMAELACLCHERGLHPRKGQCLGYKLPPILSGELSFQNIEVTDLMVHQSILGQIHRQVKNLPPGTSIRSFTVDGEEP